MLAFHPTLVAAGGLLAGTAPLKPSTSLEILADPFGLEENGKFLILAEHLKHGATKGRLVLIDPHAEPPQPSLLLSRPFRLSYPFLVEDDAQRYVVPEQAESGRLAFYRLTPNGLSQPSRAPLGADRAVRGWSRF